MIPSIRPLILALSSKIITCSPTTSNPKASLSFGTLLKANGEDVKTAQELLRHANSRITLDVHTHAVNSNKRAAQSKVLRMMNPGAGTNFNARRHNRIWTCCSERTLIGHCANIVPDFAVTWIPYIR